MIRGLNFLIGAALISGCATYAQNPQSAVYNATLSDMPESAARDMIRTYVRDVIGPDYIVDIDTLTRSHTLRAVDRGQGQVSGRPIPVPDVTFRLELTETYDGPICRLVPPSEITDAPVLILPPEVACKLIPSVI